MTPNKTPGLQIGDAVEVLFFVQTGIIVREEWRMALVIQVSPSGFLVNFPRNKDCPDRYLPFPDQGRLWR